MVKRIDGEAYKVVAKFSRKKKDTQNIKINARACIM
jgi:hypothetical protein